MREYGEFHDGWFEGLWIDAKTTHVFLSTKERERFVFVADGVAEQAIDGIKSGNIIFEVLIRDTEEVFLRDIQCLYALRTVSTGEIQGANLLEKARLQGWKILEINPSYGANCLILANSFELHRRDDWLKQYFAISKTVSG
jgi:hypothetical protein